MPIVYFDYDKISEPYAYFTEMLRIKLDVIFF
ncbi:hypothetical protein BN1058_01815 [Paraliobacillus sp. PM-2]|nr:hypothetical protein BN1058_01815 [Paraliobacillus sp. PM-2]